MVDVLGAMVLQIKIVNIVCPKLQLMIMARAYATQIGRDQVVRFMLLANSFLLKHRSVICSKFDIALLFFCHNENRPHHNKN